MWKKLVVLACVGLGLTGNCFASVDVYQVKPDDTLSQIAHRFYPGPVWSKGGSLDKIIALNPFIRDRNLIYPGQKIRIEEAEPKLANEERSPGDEAASAPPQTESPKPEKFRPYSVLRLLPTLSYSRLDSTDTINGGSSTFLSNLNPGFDLSWSQIWTQNWQSFIEMGLSHETFAGPTGKTISNPAQTLTDFFIGAKRQLSPRLSASAKIGMSQHLFNRGTPTTVTFDTVSTPEIAASVQYVLLTVDPFRVGAFAGGGYLFPAATDLYDVHSGSVFFGGVGIDQALSPGLRILGQGFYQVSSQDSSIATEQTKEVGIAFGVALSLGKPDSP